MKTYLQAFIRSIHKFIDDTLSRNLTSFSPSSESVSFNLMYKKLVTSNKEKFSLTSLYHLRISYVLLDAIRKKSQGKRSKIFIEAVFKVYVLMLAKRIPSLKILPFPSMHLLRQMICGIFNSSKICHIYPCFVYVFFLILFFLPLLLPNRMRK